MIDKRGGYLSYLLNFEEPPGTREAEMDHIGTGEGGRV